MAYSNCSINTCCRNEYKGVDGQADSLGKGKQKRGQKLCLVKMFPGSNFISCNHSKDAALLAFKRNR